MTEIKKIGVLFGSRSVEHDVSITSAYGIMKGLQKVGKYEIYPIYITKNGEWIYHKDFEDINNFKKIEDYLENEFLIDFSRVGKLNIIQKKKGIFAINERIEIDLIFPVLHGMNGEDGTVQGICQLLKIPYASTGILASAVGMNKKAMKKIFEFHNLPIVEYLMFNNEDIDTDLIERKLGYPVIIKPGNLGSSIGVGIAKNKDQLREAIEVAMHFDKEILAERAISNLSEYNCSVMEMGGEIITSEVEQPITSEGLLSFEQKYINDGGTMQGVKDKVKIPAPIEKDLEMKIKNMCKLIYKELDCQGGAPRIDFLYDNERKKLYVNEINTIPGILQLHLWKSSGVELEQFFDALIDSALTYKAKREINIDFNSNIIDHTLEFRK